MLPCDRCLGSAAAAAGLPPPQHSVMAGCDTLPVAHCVTKSHGTPSSSTWALPVVHGTGAASASTGSTNGSAQQASRGRLLHYFPKKKIAQFHVRSADNHIVEKGIYLIDKNLLGRNKVGTNSPWEVADG